MASKKNKQRSSKGRQQAAQRSASSFVEPMAAQDVKALPEGYEWLYEVKFDGYRAVLIKDGDRIAVRSWKNRDLKQPYPSVAEAGRRVNAAQVVIDGEIVAVDAQGRPSFQALQHPG
jgi:bifunctional non-homologous end joining protein LigD